ncbi:SDR family oxidoreductase [Desulfovibrionales bacterium]
MRLNFQGSRLLIIGGSSAIGLAVHDMARASGLTVRCTYASERGLAALRGHAPDQPSTNWIHQDLYVPLTHDSALMNALTGSDYVLDLAHGHLEDFMASTTDAEAYFTAHITRRQQLVRLLARDMLGRRFGRLVYISSTAAALPGPGQGFYSATKGAAEALYTSLGIELHGRGISTVCLRLGLVDGGRGKAFFTTSRQQDKLESRRISVEQAASTALFLLSDQGLAFSSTTLTMDAGLTAQKYR